MIQHAQPVSRLEHIVRETPSQLFERITSEFTGRQNGITQRYAHIPIDIPQAHFQHVMDLFAGPSGFLSLPIEDKLEFSTYVDPSEPKSHSGYEIKSRKTFDVRMKNGDLQKIGGNKDDKEFIHLNRQLLRDCAHLIHVPDRRVTAFFDAAFSLIYLPVEKTARDIAAALDTAIPGTYDRWFPQDQLPQIYLRLLAYRPDSSGDKNGRGARLGNPHHDQAAFTLALAESKPGLRIGQQPLPEESTDPEKAEKRRVHLLTYPEDTFERGALYEVTHKPGNAFLFPSQARDQVIPPALRSQFPRGYHDVLPLPGPDAYHNVPRWAIVAFLWPAVGQFSSYAAVHPEAQKIGFTEGIAASTNPDKC